MRPLHVCLILHSTRSDNLGVGALTLADVEILRTVGRRIGREIALTILDWKDPRTSYVTGPDITSVDLNGRFIADPRGWLALARRCDVIVDIGAGDSFTDIYGKKRLRRIFALKALAHLAGTPLVMAPQTIGPFNRPLSRALARATMARSAIVATRDDLSTKAARDLGYGGALVEASDVALRLPYEPAPTVPGSGPQKIGLNVSGLLMSGGYTGQNEFGLKMVYPGLIRELIRHFLDHPDGCEVHLVPHVFPERRGSNREDDYSASERLLGEFPEAVLAPRFTSPSEAKTYISGMDFFTGARMHACIAALSSGVPVAPMAYSRKFAGLFGTMGYSHTVDCTSLDAGTALAQITGLYERRAALKAEARTALTEGLTRLQRYEDALVALLEPMGANK